MPRRGGTAVLELHTRGVTTKRLEHQLSADQRRVHQLLQAGLRQIGYDIQYFLQGHAPERTEHLKHSINQVFIRNTRRPTVRIVIDVQDPEHPYDYVGVTRFGRKAVTAKRKAMPSKKLGSRPIAFGREFRRRSASALQFQPGGPGSDFIYRRRVKAYKPKGGDWIGRTAPQVMEYANEMMEEVAEYIHRGLRRGANVKFSGTRRIRGKVLR